MNYTDNNEFYEIIKDIYETKEFQKLFECKHHGITRGEHVMRVAYMTYQVTKSKNRPRYIEATRAALLHDFFTNEVKKVNVFKKVVDHPKIAVENAKKYWEITPFMEDIILTHMWPCTLRPPKYYESWLVDFLDDVSALTERGSATYNKLSTVASVISIFIMSRFR